MRRLVFMVLLIGLAASSIGVDGLAQGVRRAVVSQSVPVLASAESVEVSVPIGCVSCVVEAKLRRQKIWVRWRSFAPKAGETTVRFVPPRGFGTPGALIEDWRATATVDVALAERRGAKRKYPAKFYQGARTFRAAPAAGYKSGMQSSASDGPVAVEGGPVVMASNATSSTRDSTAKETSKAGAEAVEADIWKTDGSMVYFFNQLRGLQVVDVSDPSKPVMQARLRLPAVGQDLYLLPEQSPGERLVVLLTRAYDDASGSQSEVVVVRVSGAVAEIVSRQTVSGSLQDSRMVGTRLYMVNSDWNLYWSNYNRPRIQPVALDERGVVVGEATSGLSNTTLTELVVGSDGSLKTVGALQVPSFASSALIAAGGDWLAVASNDWAEWDKTQISLYSLSESGATLLTPKPIRTQGRVYDKFKIGFQKDTLMAVTQRWEAQSGPWQQNQVVALECFDSSGAEVTKLEIKRGENLYATRFGPEKLYIVTAVNHDPLWVVDISDPRNPLVGGHVEVPGFSTFIQPVGEDGRYLFTIGLETGRVVASLFDVSDPANPVLPENGRVQVSDDWGYSQAVWDEKALRVMPEEGLALIPFVGGWWNNNKPFVRLVDIDLSNGGSLKLRGRLEHDFAPQRATMTNGVLTSISQKELITAGIADRDNPAVLAEVALAWPVNQVLQTGDYLLQIGDGSSALWSNEPASLTVSKTGSEDTVLNTVDLGMGTVCEAAIRGSRLYVLRRSGSRYWYGNPMVLRMTTVAVSDAKLEGSSAVDPNFSGFTLDVYDVSALPAVQPLGSASTQVNNEDLGELIGGLLWINDTTPAVITQGQSWNWDWYYPMPVKLSVVGLRIAMPRRFFTPKPPVVRAFDVSSPTAPSVHQPLVLNAVTETMVSVAAAGDGLLAYAYGEKPSPVSFFGLTKNGEEPVSATHRLGVVDFAVPSAPVLRAPLQMPGRVFAVTDISRTGLLAYTETITPGTRISKPIRQVQVSVVDEQQAFLVASRSVGWDSVLAADGRSLYAAVGGSVDRLVLDDNGVLSPTASVSVGWTPTDLQTRGLTLLGISGNNLLRIGWNGLQPSLNTWKMRQGFALPKMTVGTDGSIYAPMGDFGVERYQPN